MKTEVNKNNSNLYSDLYENVSELLRTHDAEGNVVPKGDPEAVLGFMICDGADEEGHCEQLTADTYTQGRFYVKDGADFKLSLDAFDASKTYYKSDTISSLSELFAYMQNISVIDERYTRLPLDEPYFTIDLDTRTITVPPVFSKNGVSVQGDEISEILYFKCPRYYDATDLGYYKEITDTQGRVTGKEGYQIFIQWKVNTKNGVLEGASLPWIHDIESEPGYIIFGWPLSSKITQQAGQVQFSVRFYNYSDKDQTVNYSLATQPASVTIKAGLNYNLQDIQKDPIAFDSASVGLIKNRFLNSEMSNADGTKAEAPKFLNLDDGLVEILNLKADADGFYSLPVDFDVQAASGDGGQISYVWRQYTLAPRDLKDEDYPLGNKPVDYANANEIIVDSTSAPCAEDEYKPIQFQLTYVETKDEVPVTKPLKKRYYIADNTGAYKLYNGTFTKNDDNKIIAASAENKLVYERVSQAKINSIGKYVVTATNRVLNSTASTESIEMFVVRPEKPEFTGADGLLQLNKNESIQIDSENNMIPNSRVILGDNDPVKATILARSVDKAHAKVNGVLTYQWYKENEDGAYEAIEDANKNSFDINEDGFYRMVVVDHLNNEVDSRTSGIIRATHTAAKPVLVPPVAYRYSFSSAGDDGVVLSVAIDSIPDAARLDVAKDNFEADSITYRWCRYGNEGEKTNDKDFADSQIGMYQPIFDPTNNNSDAYLTIDDGEGFNEASFKPVAPDDYFCEVTNTYNGTVAKVYSPIFTVSK